MRLVGLRVMQRFYGLHCDFRHSSWLVGEGFEKLDVAVMYYRVPIGHGCPTIFLHELHFTFKYDQVSLLCTWKRIVG